jgi:hypothetical protein
MDEVIKHGYTLSGLAEQIGMSKKPSGQYKVKRLTRQGRQERRGPSAGSGYTLSHLFPRNGRAQLSETVS